MTNIDFDLGFNINRIHLDKYIKQKTEHKSIYEPSYGYTGANIKFKMKDNMAHPILSYQS